jgi:hypothetical protein
MSKSKDVSNWRRKTKLRMLEAFNNECGICGYNKSIRALHFHHINSEEKEFGLSQKGLGRSWKVIVEEMRKCVLLCSNCHCEVEDNLIEIPKNIKRFNENYSTYINEQGRLIGK